MAAEAQAAQCAALIAPYRLRQRARGPGGAAGDGEWVVECTLPRPPCIDANQFGALVSGG
jgi:hypothetical protein